MVPKTKSATAFRNDLYGTLKEVAKGDTYLVTQKDGDNVILISQEKYNKILYEQEVLREISIGVSDLEEGRFHTHKEALAFMKKLQAKWK